MPFSLVLAQPVLAAGLLETPVRLSQYDSNTCSCCCLHKTFSHPCRPRIPLPSPVLPLHQPHFPVSLRPYPLTCRSAPSYLMFSFLVNQSRWRLTPISLNI